MTQLSNGTSFSLDDLRVVMRTSAGVDDSVDLSSDIGDITFTDLGYDSLAVLQMAARIGNEYGVNIPDDAVAELPTPQSLVDYVAARIQGTTGESNGWTH
jgi:minimal PKS acyl carrier protein